MPPLLHPVIGGMFVIPVRLLAGRTDLAELRKELTADYHNPQTGETKPVRMYRQTANYIYVPRQFGRERFPDLWAIALDRTVKPTIRLGTYPDKIKPRNKQQAEFMDAIQKRLQDALFDNVIIDLQINAKTGTGKTVAAIKANADLQLAPILIVVHQNRVKEQWRGSIHLKKGYKFFYGQKWVDDNIGIVQQELCDYEGRAVVIAMGPSLISRRYPKEFYEQFGVVIVDEVHKFAAPMLSQVLSLFPAAVRVTMTATEKKGSMGKIVSYHVGKPAIISSQKAMQPVVVKIHNRMNVGWSDGQDNANMLRTLLGRSRIRNELLSQIIYRRGYQNGRQCLILSDRTNQLLSLKQRLIELGVPEEEIGVYVGAHRTGKIKLTGKAVGRDGSVIHFRGLPGFDNQPKAARYARRKAGEKLGAGYALLVKYAPEMHKPSAADYDHIENHCSIVLATYGIFDVAIDISRLDWGLEATPRSDVEQAVGRVLRIHKDKPMPVWNTVIDKLVGVIEIDHFGKTVIQQYQFKTPLRLAKSRQRSYTRQNATFKQIKDPYGALQIQVD